MAVKKRSSTYKKAKSNSRNVGFLKKVAQVLNPSTTRGKFLFFMVAFAVIGGGYFTYKTLAADALLSLPGAQSSADCASASGTVLKETSGSKRNASVCKLTSGKTIAPVIFGGKNISSTNQTQYLNATKLISKTGVFKACYYIKNAGNSSASIAVGGYAPNSNPGNGTILSITNTDYKEFCDPVLHTSGAARIFLKVNSGTVHVSSISIAEGKLNTPPPPTSSKGIWLSQAEIKALPTSGKAWDNVKSAAYGNWGSVDLSDNDSTHDTSTLAGALVAVRLDDASLKQKVRDAIMSTTTTTKYARALEASRNLTCYIIAADIIGLSGSDKTAFTSYLSRILVDTKLSGHSGGEGIYGTALKSSNNWGGKARAATTAALLYMGDTSAMKLQDVITAHRGFLGENVADQIKYTSTNWHATSDKAGVNRRGATIQGQNVDGVQPEDQRRTGEFTWPAPKGSYPWEGLQGPVITSAMLHRAGKLDFRKGGDDALVRAYHWLWNVNNNTPATNDKVSDDRWQLWVVNKYAGVKFPTESPVTVGKNMGWTDWTHQ